MGELWIKGRGFVVLQVQCGLKSQYNTRAVPVKNTCKIFWFMGMGKNKNQRRAPVVD
jgi:hypothetical protein